MYRLFLDGEKQFESDLRNHPKDILETLQGLTFEHGPRGNSKWATRHSWIPHRVSYPHIAEALKDTQKGVAVPMLVSPPGKSYDRLSSFVAGMSLGDVQKMRHC